MSEGQVFSDTFPVLFKPLDRTLDVRSEQTILEAALSAGYPLPYSCKSGVCGSCKARVVDGELDPGMAQSATLTQAEIDEGYTLLCQSKPRSALTVECNVVPVVEGYPVRKLACRVDRLERLADDVMRIRLRLPVNQSLAFLPGQYINIAIPGGIRRSLSIANSPDDAGFVELHLRNYDGPFSRHVFGKMAENDLLRFEGPLGTFFIREATEKPIIFVASGTGFAPIKSMIEQEVRKGHGRPMTLYWGGRRPKDLYLHDVAKAWVTDVGLNYVPVISDASAEDSWTGRSGFVHQAVMEDFADLSQHQVYACGAPIVVQSARKDFINERRLPETEFFADIFVSGATPAA
ncbi:CDP-6-deoxy-delta-3,4-glucoseen reductase [Caballeronia novacaledonica]|uniref:CDP-6-deoxy-delta-3,4-glucoseen reductase n=1 Tax=Caballeronia novacaledonica TaxID=1544861 RepID=A0A2U3I3W4_9BURK|nr:CDP-6-deoxy-delta-3,4-glucoseen reductase [Caballeronia novacaledonica]SPB14804.1 CDP-6-deoxy-delta-3,4-glucoseen reductase [Caballeronia novacaledonica]